MQIGTQMCCNAELIVPSKLGNIYRSKWHHCVMYSTQTHSQSQKKPSIAHGETFLVFTFETYQRQKLQTQVPETF